MSRDLTRKNINKSRKNRTLKLKRIIGGLSDSSEGGGRRMQAFGRGFSQRANSFHRGSVAASQRAKVSAKGSLRRARGSMQDSAQRARENLKNRLQNRLSDPDAPSVDAPASPATIQKETVEAETAAKRATHAARVAEGAAKETEIATPHDALKKALAEATDLLQKPTITAEMLALATQGRYQNVFMDPFIQQQLIEAEQLMNILNIISNNVNAQISV